MLRLNQAQRMAVAPLWRALEATPESQTSSVQATSSARAVFSAGGDGAAMPASQDGAGASPRGVNLALMGDRTLSRSGLDLGFAARGLRTRASTPRTKTQNRSLRFPESQVAVPPEALEPMSSTVQSLVDEVRGLQAEIVALKQGSHHTTLSAIESKLNTLAQHVVQLGSEGSANGARERIVQELIQKGMTREVAVATLEAIDRRVDFQRRLLNAPYMAALIGLAVAVPGAVLLVYDESFYNKVLEMAPHLEKTSWDWSEPLVQTLLTVQTGAALALACLAALRITPYRVQVQNWLAKEIQKHGISKKAAKDFIKHDT